MPPSDAVKAYQRWFDDLETRLQNIRRGFDVKQPKRNVDRLSLKGVSIRLDDGAQRYWSLDQPIRTSLAPRFVRYLATIKLLADDVFVESVAALESKRGTQAEVDVGKQYAEVVERLIRYSPYLFTRPALDATKLPLFVPRNAAGERISPVLRRPLVSTFSPALDPLMGPWVSSIAAHFAREIEVRLGGVIGSKTADFALDERETHLLGMYFLIIQLYLGHLYQTGEPIFPGDYWYELAGEAITELRTRVLGLHTTLERASRLAGNDALAATLASAGADLIDVLARTYSLRSVETSSMWAFQNRRLVKGGKQEIFLESRVLVGVNGKRETLMSYLGRPNPDADENLEPISVDLLLERRDRIAAASAKGETVVVFGTIHARRNRLLSLATDASVEFEIASGHERDVDLAEPRAARGIGVVLEGRLDIVAGAPQLVVSKLTWYANAYQADVGFPIRRTPGPGPLGLRPDWRTETEALRAAARLEQRLDSIPVTLVGQDRLVLDLLGHQEIRTALGKRAAKLTALDLHDQKVRAIVWPGLFAKLHKADVKTSIARLLEQLQRFLTHFTRHTLWNLRDEGTPYFDTIWPLSISGKALHDCGVYSLMTASDLYRSVAKVAGVHIDFGFVTFLNHIALVGYAGDESFFVNNDLISGPQPMPKLAAGASAAEQRANFALNAWGPEGFVTVYQVTYAVALVRVPIETISSAAGDGTFKARMWARYQVFAKWWGLQPPPVADNYHKAIAEFDKGMKQLDRLLDGKTAAQLADPTSDLMKDAASRAKRLFAIADDLALPTNFGQRTKEKIREASTMGVIHPLASKTPIGLYRTVQLMLAAKQAGRTLTQDQQDLLVLPADPLAHTDRLNPKKKPQP
jgi:hypothetical protein